MKIIWNKKNHNFYYQANKNNNGGKKKNDTNVCMHLTSKRIELKSPDCSGLVKFLIFYKTWPTVTL